MVCLYVTKQQAYSSHRIECPLLMLYIFNLPLTLIDVALSVDTTEQMSELISELR